MIINLRIENKIIWHKNVMNFSKTKKSYAKFTKEVDFH